MTGREHTHILQQKNICTMNAMIPSIMGASTEDAYGWESDIMLPYPMANQWNASAVASAVWAVSRK